MFLYATSVHYIAELQQRVENAGETVRGKAQTFLICATIHEAAWPSCVEMGRQHIKQLLLYNNLRYDSQAVIPQYSKSQKGHNPEM